MTKDDAIGFYHSLLRFGVKPGLDRISVLLSRLGNPQDKLKFIHIAGTNGKGSVCTELSNVLRCAGYKTGLYTSPYVIDFSERIQINNVCISDESLIECTEIVKNEIINLSDEGIVITEFEAIAAAAFLYFDKAGCDIVVLETGLGGRFDATNVISDCVCSIITSVSLDHTEILGNTITAIAGEKCGIFKTGKPVIFSETQKEEFTSVAYDTATTLSCPVYIARPSEMDVLYSDLTGTEIKYKDVEILIPFPGEHQTDNTALVLAATEILNKSGYNIAIGDVKKGIESSFIPARTEIISRNPLVILDGCHNPDSTKALADCLKYYASGLKLQGITAMMRDKDCETNFKNLGSLFDRIICTGASNPRSADAFELAKTGLPYCECKPIANQSDAVNTALSDAKYYDGTIFFGSLYFASDIRNLLTDYFKHI